MSERPPDDIAGDVQRRIDAADDQDDDARLDALETIHRDLESELDEGAETQPPGH